MNQIVIIKVLRLTWFILKNDSNSLPNPEKINFYTMKIKKNDLENFHAPGMMSEQFGIRFKMFLIVELTKLGGQNFKLDL